MLPPSAYKYSNSYINSVVRNVEEGQTRGASRRETFGYSKSPIVRFGSVVDSWRVSRVTLCIYHQNYLSFTGGIEKGRGREGRERFSELYALLRLSYYE